MPHSQALVTAVPKGFIRVWQSEQEKLTVRIGTPAALMSNGYGGWEIIRRPRQDALVEWTGHDAMQLDVPVMFDGLLPDLNGALEEPWGDSVESDIRMLEHFTHKVHGANSPPRLWVLGEVIPHTDREWVLNDIKWAGDDIRRPTDGARVRASATLTFLEYIDYQLINGRISAAKKRAKKNSKNAVKTKQKKGTYIVKEGDTLRKIAQRELGSASRWHEIAKANKIRDGSVLPKGTKLKMP